ncbi:MAG: serine/threonine-protein kinase, partial [Myxococcota bacterium]
LQMQRACMADGVIIHPGIGAHIMVQILEGLHYAHTRVLDDGRSLDLVHRDITPGNILIGFDGTVKLTDFGIAKSALSNVKTRVGVVKGTTRYLSPEQIRAQPIAVQSDVFSAAVVLTELLTGKPLFDRGSVAPTLFAIVNKERPKVSKLLPFEAPELAIVLESALDTDPRRRPPTARALADGLRWAAQAQGWTEERAEVRDLMKRLFPESLTEPERLPSTIKATSPRLDLTYLLEVSTETEDDWSTGSTTHIEEELRVLLQGMVSGSAPLDASQFAPAHDEDDQKTVTSSQMLSITIPAGAEAPVAENDISPKIGSSKKPPPVPPPDPPELTHSPELASAPELLSPSVASAVDASANVADLAVPAASTLDAFQQVDDDQISLHAIPIPEKSGGRWIREVLALCVGFALGVGAAVFLLGPQMRKPIPEPEVSAAQVTPKPPPPQAPEQIAAAKPPPPKVVPQKPKPAPAPKTVASSEKVESAEPAPPKPPAKGPGYLTVRSPRGARVYIDGVRLRRKVPFKRVRIRKGRRVVKISKRRYLRIFEIQMKPGLHLDATGGRTRPIEPRTKKP